MNSSKWIWRIVGSISIAATLLLLYGFFAAIRSITVPESAVAATLPSADQSHATSGNNPIPAEIKVVAIGDSLAKGTGDDSGSGFVRRAVSLLDKQNAGSAQLINNLGINGLTTKTLLAKLDEPGVDYVLKEANVIMLSIGGNDLFQGAQAAQTGSEMPTVSNVRKALPEASKRLELILDKLEMINPDAKIIYLGLYNPFGDMKEMKVPGNVVVSEWNQTALSIMNQHQQMTLIPTFDLFQQNLLMYLSSDHFHPNDLGYQAIAERIVQGFATIDASKEGTNP